MSKRWKQTLQVAATYVGTVVGAGFATGREVVEFFTRYGWNGLLGICLSSLFFVWLGTKMMILSAKIDAYSFQDLIVHLSGKKVGRVFNLFMLIILIGVTSVMLSGAGAVFGEQLGVSYQLGIYVTIFLCFFVMQRGLSGIMIVNSIIVPLMVLFSLFISYFTVNDLLDQSHLNGSWILFSFSETDWLMRSLNYASLNLCLAQAVLVPLGRDIKDEIVLKRGGVIGGIGLCFMLICAHFSLLSLQEVASYDIPMAEVIKHFGKWIHLIFLFVIYGEIFTTLVGNVFGITRQLHVLTEIPERWLAGFILVLCLLISQIGFSTLLSYLYPLFGYIGFFFLLLLVFSNRMTIGKR